MVPQIITPLQDHLFQCQLLERLQTKTIFRFQEVENIVLPVSYTWTSGAEKDKKDFTPLENINALMDDLAGEHVRKLITSGSRPQPLFLPSQKLGVRLNNVLLVANTEDKIRANFYKSDIRKHYHNTVGLSSLCFEEVNWEAIRLATRKHKNRKQILKCLHNQWPVLDRNYKWNMIDNNICTMCNVHVETWQHVLQCSSIHMARCRNNSISTLKKELQILKTNPALLEHFIAAIYDWTNGVTPSPPPISYNLYINEIRQAHIGQLAIGYDLFMKGLLDKRWHVIQERYIADQKLGKKYNIQRWNKRLTELLLEHCVTCYKERCTIVAAEGQSDYEKSIRSKAKILRDDIMTNQWKVPGDSNHLIDRSDRFFSHGNILSITEWTKNVSTAMERSNRKIGEVGSNINETFTQQIQDKREKNTPAADFRKQLKVKAKNIRSRIQQNIASFFRLKY